MYQLRWVIVMMGALMAARIAAADSLWPKDGESLYRDKKAFKIGDVLTVIVSESASASHSADTKASKRSSSGVSWGAQRSSGGVPFQDFGISGKEDVQGGGRSVRSGALTGRITVRVTEVLPNGNLIINGNREITVNDEKQVMEITGIVRPEDVMTDNSVLSMHVADARIKYTGRGGLAEKARLGLISRLLSMLWVF